uniref:PremRNAprocessing protein putative n=1 Tax=Albugo laibachii Nc14 TaxID=890382 RepID=F0WX33_9STRA|nr:premRNAprocessing protein putative [Albugo laibachii Nc14]|eukprot:CCA26022.1 premRNAprocessing protein putative [Albugo laibachii Nc14]
MSTFLPAPVRSYTTYSDVKPVGTVSKESKPHPTTIPSYPHRLKAKFIPRSLQDFGNGGAYPEIHVAQFPLYMGKKKPPNTNASSTLQHSTSAVMPRNDALALQVHDLQEPISYDAIVTQHHRDKQKVYTRFTDIVEKPVLTAATQPPIPSQAEEEETTCRTKFALQALVQGKIAAALPVNVNRQKTAQETSSYVRYTPHDKGKMGGGQQQRIIRLVEAAKDPMEPPKFKHKKTVRGPPSPPVPVLHSPPRKLTVEDQQAWKIPPCISNWKNSKGFTIALDKRLAADGRGLQQVTVNDNFASFSEALSIAERKAREEVNMRSQVRKKVALKQKEQKEKELRELALKARMERAGIRENSRRHSVSSIGSSDEDEGLEERERLRRERKKDREREMRLEKLGKKGKFARDQDRDVSEKIALGQLQGSGKLSGDTMYDSRLFNQSQGMDAGFGQEDDYNVYSKPLLDRGKASVYRPKADESLGDADQELDELKSGHQKRFKADKQSKGTEIGKRDGPVQFSYDKAESDDSERSPTPQKYSKSAHRSHHKRSLSRSPRKRSRSPDRSRRRSRSARGSRRGRSKDDDPFGLDQFLSDARKGRNR